MENPFPLRVGGPDATCTNCFRGRAWAAVGAVLVAVFLLVQTVAVLVLGFAGQVDASEHDKGQSTKVAVAKLNVEEIYPSANTCAACHPKQYAEWSVSQHAYAQLSPVYMAFQMAVNGLTSSTNGDFCMRCHNQIGMNMRESLFLSNLDRPASSREGITCSVCHRVSQNYGKVSGRLPLVRAPMHGALYGPSGSKELKRVIADPDEQGYRVVTDPSLRGLIIHSEVKQLPALTKPASCGTCHDVTLLNGFRLEEAFSEYKQTDAAAEGVTCQDCHMGKVPGVASGYEWGPAATINGIPTTPRRLTDHFFAGPDYSLIHPGFFPHNVEAAEFADMRSWLQFDWRAGWGTAKFEEMAAIAVEAIVGLSESLEKLAKALADGTNKLGVDALAEHTKLLAEAVAASDAPRAKEVYKQLMAAVDAFVKGAASRAATAEQLAVVQAAVKTLASTLAVDFPERWSDPFDRGDAREILDVQYKRLEWAREQRLVILRNGFKLDDIVVEKAGPDGIDFSLTVRNGTNGHAVPTGFDAERLIFLEVTVTDSNGKVVYVSGDRDPNGDVRDAHSLYVHEGLLPVDRDLFNLQSKFLVRLFRGGEREQVLAINKSLSPQPFIRPETRPTVLYGRPRGARKHKKSIEPLGRRTASYSISGDKLDRTGRYDIRVRMIAQSIPINLLFAIQGAGFDYQMSPKEIADRVLEGAEILWERAVTVDLGQGNVVDIGGK